MSEAVPETPEAESLEQLGAELWQRRKQAGYSLSEVADAIRINQEVLKTIETGQIDYAPGQTFIRGFMRSYARFLDMDPQVFQKRLNAIMGAENKTAPHRILPVQDIKSDSRTQNRWVWVSATVVIVGMAVAWYVMESQLDSGPSEAAVIVEPKPATEATPEPQAPASQVTETAESSETVAEEQAVVASETTTAPNAEQTARLPETFPAEPQAVEVGEAVAKPISTSGPTAQAEESEPAEATAVMTEETIAEAATAASIAGAQVAPPGLQLTVDAHERVWISLEIDGKTGVDVLLEVGDTYEWEANVSYVLTVGNVHSVEVKLNGKPLKLDSSQDLLLDHVLDASLLN